MDFKNKNVVITGGSSGIGFASAMAFINEGANVWITGRNEDKLKKAVEAIGSKKINAVVSDTSNLEGIGVLEKVIAESGVKVDVLYLNAGIATYAPIEYISEEDFDAQFNTNVKGPLFTMQKLLPYLADGASVLFTSSTVASASGMNSSVYSATKGALNKIAQVAANELAERKIRVNLISPGPTETEGLDGVVTPEIKDFLSSVTALQRLGNPKEIANTVLFLASEKASFITGTELLIDGGAINYMMK